MHQRERILIRSPFRSTRKLLRLASIHTSMNSRYGRASVQAIGWCLTCCTAFAGEFVVNPVRLDISPNAKSASVSVANDGADRLSFQLQAMEWSQDKEGKDQYTESRDLIFFPKLMSVEPGQEAIVRVGFRTAAATVEKTYRLFIEELPSTVRKPEVNGAQINFLVRFGLPIFAAPVLPQDGLAIETLELKSGVISFTAKNTGNRHQMYKSIRISGVSAANNAVFGLDIADRYLLASSSKPYQTTLSAQQCKDLSSVNIEIQTDKLTQSRKLEVTPSMCL